MSDEYPLMAFIANEGVAPKGDRYDRSALVTDTANKLYKKTEIGDFIYSSNNLETGSIGLNKYGKACISPVYSIFEPTGIADSDFLGRRLVRKDFINAMVKWRQGVIYGQWRIHESDFLKIEIPVPSVVEQRKIGAYLDQLDRLITLHQREFAFLCKEKSKKFRYIKNAWEQRKFDEVFDCTVPNNTLSRAELSYDEGTVLNVHYGDVLIKYGSVLDVQKDDIPRIPYRCREDFNGALLQDGDVIIADTAEDETTGKACEIGNLQGRAIVSGLHTMVCRPRHRMALGYLGHYLNSNAYHHQLLPLMQGIKVLSLSRSNIQKTSVSYPTVEKEQQLIANYFSQLDNLITLHQRKYDKLTNVKKSMLEKMFPQNGSNVPEIRFKGFTEAWEQRKFSELVQIERGGSPRPIDDFITDAPNGLNWVKIGDAPTQGNYITKTAEKIRPEGLPKTREVHPGDLILSNSMSFGKPYIMGIDGCIHDGWLLIRNTYGVFDLTFLCHLLGTPQMLSQYRSLAAGSTVNNLNKELVGNIYVTIPSITEQRVLGAYLEQLDNLITLHQRELEKLKNLKKACLEKMFV